VHAAAAEARRKRREGTRLRLQRCEPAPQRSRRLLRESGAHLAGADDAPGVVVTPDDQRADAGPRALRIGEAADHELGALQTLRLEPPAVPSRVVRQIAALRHDALEPETAHLGEERRPVADDVLGELQDAVGATVCRRRPSSRRRRASMRRFSWPSREEAREDRFPALEREARDVLAVEVEEIEDEVDERRTRAAAEGVLQILEARPAVGSHARDLAVEDCVSHPEASYGIDDLGKARRAVVAGTADEAHVAVVDETADAVPVVLELVQPGVARRRLAYQARELWREMRAGCRRARTRRSASHGGAPHDLVLAVHR